jgi:16S rRNA (guanine527-N7)-methyltransferase
LSRQIERPLDVLARGGELILGRALAPRAPTDFGKYLNILMKWQKTQRLAGSSDPMWIVEHLFLDSLLFLKLLPVGMRTLVDVGSGAGVPGLPIKIVRPEVDVTLVESRRRRASFLSSVARELGLSGLHIVSERVGERASQELEGRFDAVVMRCAGDVNTMLPLGAQLAMKGGLVVAAGPPKPAPLTLGQWVTVAGWPPGRTRTFAVYQVAEE